MLSETMLSPAVHVLPTCWLFTPEPSVQVICTFFVSTSPESRRINPRAVDGKSEPTELDGAVGG